MALQTSTPRQVRDAVERVPTAISPHNSFVKLISTASFRLKARLAAPAPKFLLDIARKFV
ncbi:MAG TPA: hypothetical protein VHH73_06955 [Verrucomicrobiae bacterium]|nr:hypothetical protein [Verrucomicrobiae bacterium]